jgi:hypothetical protein
VRLEELSKLKNVSNFTGNLTRDLPACSIVPHGNIAEVSSP